jgi:hypothetical protein
MMETKFVTLPQSATLLSQCFGLPSQPDVCNYDVLEGLVSVITGESVSADQYAALFLLTGSKISSVGVLGSSLIGGPLGMVADLINTIISGKCMSTNSISTGGGRRLLAGNPLELENVSFLMQVVNDTIQTAKLLDLPGLNNITDDALTAVVSAMVVVNSKLQEIVSNPAYVASMLGNATASAELLKRLYTIDVVTQTTFKNNIQALANGSL